ncbi:hypothetical protein EJ03DRAFT_318394 [Teratosphaeria nubilosa]|uniref:dolichol kinase n=1 Tax=Teratosphaeria nubilosa TaxID=161662 RepID=A0A6G1KZ95_9PEZI|nr:hypothetical protein EJ03DRAFT_318394 [Teratosphaeria nubilosa]
MSNILDAPTDSTQPNDDTIANGQLSIDEAEGLRNFSRTPRPYHRDAGQIDQDRRPHLPTKHNESKYAADAWKPETESGQVSMAGSESGTEADDERPTFVRALPPAVVRLRKGLKTGEQNEDVLLTPSQLDDEGRRIDEGYFKHGEMQIEVNRTEEEEAAEQDKLLRIRLAEFARRSSEVGLMVVTVGCVLCGHKVFRTAVQWQRELLSHVAIIVTLILAYPVKLSVVDTSAQHSKLAQRFRVPASFDPATALYPPLLPVLVALLVSPDNQAVILPNIILGLASLPQRLFPRSSRLGGINALHWLVSIIPLILSAHCDLTYGSRTTKPYNLKVGSGLSDEILVSLYPLHHALLVPLHYLTTTSLLISELHLLSVALINLLLLASSPQTVIMKACLWLGGVSIFVLTGPVLHWNVTLARVPKWKLRRAGHTAEERKSLVDAVTELLSIQRAAGAFRFANDVNSDADEDEPRTSIKDKINGIPQFATIGLRRTISHSATRSAVEPYAMPSNGFVKEPNVHAARQTRTRRNTLPAREAGTFERRESSSKRKFRSRLLWCLQLTPQQAQHRKWIYAACVYVAVIAVALGLVRWYIEKRALHGQDPFGWALSYLFGQISVFRLIVGQLSLQRWIPLPPGSGTWRDLTMTLPLDVNGIRSTLGFANVRLLLIAYWAIILVIGLLTVFSLTAFVEVDTRRKVFHGVMVAMLLPSIFIDPCYCALALGLVLVVFLLLEVIRAGQVPPIGNAIGRFVAPYVDGRDLRGPVVVSHIFLLIGCAVPLWFSLASIKREDEAPWIGWELQNNEREVAMVAGVVCVGMGDAAASLIGRRYGRHKWIWVGGKSLEGSAAFAAAVTVGLMFAKVWQVMGGWSDTGRSLEHHLGRAGAAQFSAAWVVSLVKAIFSACGASFMEAVLTGANDNVVVPVALWLLVKGTRF